MASLRLEEYIKQLQDPVPDIQDPEDLGDETAARLAPDTTNGDADDDDDSALQRSSSLRRRAAIFEAVRGGKVTSRKELYGDSDDDNDDDVDDDIDEAEKGGKVMSKKKLCGDDDDKDSESGNGTDNDDDDDDEEDFDEDEDEEKEESGEETDDNDDNIDEEEEEVEKLKIPDKEEEEEEVAMLSDDDDDGDDSLVVKDTPDDEESDEDEDEEEKSADDDEEITSAESGEEEHSDKTEKVDEGEKAQAVVQQLDFWDRLMEARIQMQKVVTLVNRLQSTAGSQQPTPLTQAKDVLVDISCCLCDTHHTPPSPRKRMADSELEELVEQSQHSLVESRNSTLTFWDEKTRLASKKFKSFKSYQTPVVKQVEQILADRDRLVRRTRVLRDVDDDDTTDSKLEEVFDDNDFYQRLLKHLVDSKTAEDCDMSTSASQWLEVQRLRGKKKKKKDIDTRASKGRKLRYNVHTKLVNFMAPSDHSTWSTDARDELFKNLFKISNHYEQ